MRMNDYFVDDYQILLNKPLGKGQYGEVFDCKSNKHPSDSLCAKIMQVKDPQTKKYQEREKLISEIVQKNVGNQNIVKIYYVKEIKQENKLIIIMEKCESNLQKLIEEKKQFNDIEVFEFLDQFLNGYSVLYKLDIMHRDIKPENILIKKINEKIIYKLADFGIGKIYKANDFFFTKVGTPAYAAPEINSEIQNDSELNRCFSQLKKYNHSRSQVDVYSLGIILHQLVFGQLPFEKSLNSIKDFTEKIKKDSLKLLGKSQYVDIIQKMLIYYPDKRMSFEYLYQFAENKKQTRITCPQFNIKNDNYQLQLIKRTIPSDNNKNGQINLFIQGQGNKLNNNGQGNQLNNNGQGNQFNNNGLGNQLNNNGLGNQLNNNGLGNQFNNFGYGNQFNNNALGNQFKQNQINQPPVKVFFSPPSPHCKIKEYLQFLLNDHGDIIKDDKKYFIQFLIQNSTFSTEQLKELLMLYQNKIQNPNFCESRTLTFFYCIVSLLNDPAIQTIQNLDDNKTKEEITRLYNNLGYFSLQRL